MNGPSTFTLRFELELASKLEALCQKKGFNKNDLINSLIREFLQKEESNTARTIQQRRKLQDLVGIIHLGGDAVQDSEDSYF